MAWQSSGGLQLPGVTSDGANGLAVADALNAGDGNKAPQPDFHQLTGSTVIQEGASNFSDDDGVLDVIQSHGAGPVGNGSTALFVGRSGSTATGDWGSPAVILQDGTASLMPVLRIRKGGITTLEINTQKSITGALSAVTDAAAKAVLTSIIAALTGIKVATNNTT